MPLPVAETLLQRLAIEQRKQAAERVVARNAVRQLQVLTKPVFFRLTVFLDRHEIVRVRQHPAQRDHHHVAQLVPAIARAARIGQLTEIALDGLAQRFGHGGGTR